MDLNPTNAKRRFELTYMAIGRLNDVKRLIMYECDDWKPPDVPNRHQTSDPTAQAAIYRVDELGEKLEALKLEESELERFIGETLKILDAVNSGFGEIYAQLLELRYVDGVSWAEIYDRTGIKKSKGHYLLNIAFDWIDSVGVARILGGEFEI